jgi:hypothetical protein
VNHHVAMLDDRRGMLDRLATANALDSANAAVWPRDISIGNAMLSLYEAPPQLAEVLDALCKGAEIVMVTGEPAMGKSLLALEVMRRIEA